MSDWLTDLIQGATTTFERTVKWDDEERTVHFRRITASERMQLLQGQKFLAKNGQAEVEVDLGANEGTKHRMVHFATCKPDGSRLFGSVKDVGKLPAGLVNLMFKHASEINKDADEEEVGKD